MLKGLRCISVVVILGLALPAAAVAAGPDAASSIVGGRDAAAADWPSIAFLLAAWDEDGDGELDSAASCTGTVIAPSWVLSAAHCAFRPDGAGVDAMLALTGVADINDPAAESIAADRVVIHPAWNPVTVAGDALLVHLDTPSARPAMPLARTGGEFDLDPTVPNLAGWGNTDEASTLSTDVLKEAFVSIVDDETCAVFAKGFDPRTQTCAGEYETAGACHGDSGGPLTVLDAQGTPHLWGLTSYGTQLEWGMKPCELHAPAVFSRVPAFAGWVDAETAEAPQPPPPVPGPQPGPPPPGPLPTTPADTQAPALTGVKLSVTRIRAAKRGATLARKKAGAKLSFTLDEAAAVTVTVLKRGKPRGGAATLAAPAGRTTKRFTARAGGRALRRGAYKLRVSAVDAAGNAAPSVTLRIRVV